MKYRFGTAEINKEIHKTMGMRNELLAKAIEENRAPNRRLFVIAGGLHLFKIDSKHQQKIGKVKEAIKKHPFVIVAPSKMQKHFETLDHNPDYKKIPPI